MDLDCANSSHITPQARQHVLKAYDIPDAAPLAIGTEAEVYEYTPDQVLKIYADSSRVPHFKTLREFYRTLDSRNTTLTLPEIIQITQHDNLIATLERRVAGVPLADKLPTRDDSQRQQVQTLYLDAVFQLQQITLSEPPTTYLLFDASQESLCSQQSFNQFYARFLKQKIERVGRYFVTAVPGFSRQAAQLVHVIRHGTTSRLALVHGDVFPGNVLVNEALTAVHGIVDFGAFTLRGNYLLDVAGAFGFYRMYAPDRRQIRQTMLPHILDRLTTKERPVFFSICLPMRFSHPISTPRLTTRPVTVIFSGQSTSFLTGHSGRKLCANR